MSDEQLLILDMLRDGKISPEQAENLLRAIPSAGRDGGPQSVFERVAKKLAGMKVIPSGAKFDEETNVQGPLTIGGGAKFEKEVGVKGPLSIGGGTKFQGNVDHSGAFNCGGSVKFEGEAKVSADGVNIGGSLKFSDKAEVSVSDKIKVKGDLILESGAQLSVTGDVVVDGKVINKQNLSSGGDQNAQAPEGDGEEDG